MERQTADQVGEVLTVPEVAADLRLDATTVSKMCRTGEFPGAFRTGNGRGRWRIPAADLSAHKQSAPIRDELNRRARELGPDAADIQTTRRATTTRPDQHGSQR